MNHFTTPRFWRCYHSLPREIRELADKNFLLLKNDPHHPSLHFKKAGKYWSVRVGEHYRALGRSVPSDDMAMLWHWIGSHAEYDTILGN